jgi:hypothetical protein
METKTKFISNVEPKNLEYGTMTVQEMGKLGGLSKSKEKVRASRINGKKGGRPRKKI